MIFRFSGLWIAALFFVFAVTPVLAQAAEVKIAVVDMNKLLSDSKAGKSVQKQLSERREAFQKEFSKRENDLMKAQKSLIEKKKEMTSDQFLEKRKDFEKQLGETRKLFQKRRNGLDKGLGNALSSLRKNIIQVTAEVADKEKYQIVLARDSVVIVQKEMDITDQVLAALDKKIKTVKLDVTK